MDAALKKLVSGRLRMQPVGPHPDAELLAACAENSLSRRDHHNLLTHLAACADCRDALYLALPEVDTPTMMRPHYKSPRLAVRWATLAASVVILGAVLLTNREMFYQHSSSVQTYTAAPVQKVVEPTADRPSETRAPAIQAAERLRPPLKHMTAKPQATMQFDQSGEVHFASPQAASGANHVSAARVSSEETAYSRDKMTTSPVNWSLSSNGEVQRSLDSGRTWQSLPVAGSPFRAISSIGNDIWVGGSAGTLYHSADSGQSWTRVDPVSSDDITRIEFSDAQNGLLNTANGQVWSTSDGGRSWHSK
jgi:Photosynthesis system II assembly factor YCF48